MSSQLYPEIVKPSPSPAGSGASSSSALAGAGAKRKPKRTARSGAADFGPVSALPSDREDCAPSNPASAAPGVCPEPLFAPSHRGSSRVPVAVVSSASLALSQQRSLADTIALAVAPGVVLPAASLASTPSTNRGVESAELDLQGGRQAFVDWLCFSVTKPGAMFNDVDDWRRWLSGTHDLEDAGWRAGNGGRFYRESWHLGGWTLYYDGRQDGMGYCVQFSGAGCRELEAHPHFSTWEKFLYGLLGKGGSTPVNITRLDAALDDKEGALDLVEIERKTRAGEYACRGGSDVDASPSTRSSRPRGSKAWGVTVYFGRRTSSQLVRMYDKAVEQANKLGQEVGGHWVRVEYEAHDKRAMALAEQIVMDGLGSVAGVVLNYLDFKEAEATNAQKCRQKTCAWWSSFLSGWEKVRLSVAPVERTILKVRLWLETQVAPSLATAYESLVGPQRKGFLADLVQGGQQRMKKRHRDLLARDKALAAAVAPVGGPTGF